MRCIEPRARARRNPGASAAQPPQIRSREERLGRPSHAAVSTAPTALVRPPSLAVGLQQVVRREARDRSAIADAAMRAMMVVGVEPGGKGVGALLGVIVGPGVSPFAHGGLDKAFGLAVGARCIGTGKEVPHPAAAAQVGNKGSTVGGAVVGHDACDGDPQRLEVIEGAGEEGSSGFLALVGQDFGVGQARVVVDTNVGDLEASAGTAFLVGASNARTDAMEAAKLLGVEVEQVAGRGVLVALYRRRWWVERAQPGQPGPLEQAARLCGVVRAL